MEAVSHPLSRADSLAWRVRVNGEPGSSFFMRCQPGLITSTRSLIIAPMLNITSQGGDVLLPVKVVPNASRDRIVGELDGSLKVSVAVPPERGAANSAVCKLIARALGLRVAQVRVETGATSPRKTLRIFGTTPEQVGALAETRKSI
ncbi:MAG: DUF167 domain-containing protein [Phycisphaerales bacterium]|nr:DUF167 domain-containing protein [Phycisphaerales bacterium]